MGWLCGWETLSTAEPSTHLEFLRAAEGWASVNNNHWIWQSHRNSGEANRDVWPLLPSSEPNQAQRALLGVPTGAVGARPVRPWCLGLTPSPWRRAGEGGRAHGQGCSTSLHLCSGRLPLVLVRTLCAQPAANVWSMFCV